jgi:2-haloacid dehalogenase
MAESDIRAVAFDVNETLFPLDPLGAAFTRVGLEAAAVPLWFARLLRDGFALAAIGQYRPFAAVATVLEAFRELRPHPDVAPALAQVRAAGVPAVTLTNGSADLVAALLTRSGLADLVDRHLSVDEVRRWKPAPGPYLWAAAQLGVDPSRLALVASHPWDCAGAQAAGLVSAWVNRTGAPWPAFFAPPNVTEHHLTDVVAQLVGPAHRGHG